MNFFISDAYAQAAGGASNTLVSLLPMVLIFAVFYFLLIRPQQKRQKEHREMVANIGKNDEVLTNGGLLGKVVKVGESYVSIELGEGMVVKMQASAVSQVLPKGTLKAA
ncbi:MAG: preprotein translocase subunit YajC [Arenicellales bacterium]